MTLGFVGVTNAEKYQYELIKLANTFVPRPGRVRSAVGMSGSAQLRAVYNPTASTKRVMRIEGMSGFSYLRGMAYRAYRDSDHAWHPTDEERNYSKAPAVLTSPAGPTRASVSREPDSLEMLYLPLNVMGIACEGSLDTDEYLGSMRRSSAGEEPTFVYKLQLAGRGEAGPFETSGVGPPDLEVPAGVDGRVRELAGRIAGNLASADAKALAVTRYLADNHRYSLNYDPGRDGDPVSNFLLKGGSAHCMYFAAAGAILLREVGVPARYVQGYVAHESDGPDALIVRQRDAHAWVEYHDGRAWKTLEVTPPSGRPEANPPVPAWRKWMEKLGDWWEAFKTWLMSLGWSALTIAAAGLIVVALIIQAIKNRSWRKRRSKSMEYVGDPALVAIARQFEKVLKRFTGEVSPDRTWREHLEQVGRATSPDHGRPRSAVLRPLVEFVRVYEAARFDRADSAVVDRLNALIGELQETGKN